MSIYSRLSELALALLEPAPPVAAFAPFVHIGDLLFVSGHIAKRDGEPWVGQLGAGLGTEEGKLAARSAAIDLLGTLQAATGDLDRVQRIVNLMVLGNTSPPFRETPLSPTA